MKTYLNDPMQGMQQMGNKYGMQQMNGMQNMYPMMDGMQKMAQMMYMQSMYQMMCMKNMYAMMGMDEMSPMMGMAMQFPIPRLEKLEQLSPTQIQISYDRDVDVMLGMKSTNYWIKDTLNTSPKGIATLGKNDNVNAGNSLTDSMVRVDSRNGSARTFILTFNQTIPTGAEYMLIICYVTVAGTPPYSGDNGMATFIGK
ncbi:hypothetical protein [Clostridium estertheticum]|uniref:Uncharacterized protein n=1 Tax=Clostridium estertheticum TaxID=238834 RepID=A0A7Y3SS62_9CLOT|nr:hypothetical protein [Clostridium estertheticum]NNU74333.1 hypothetical protein [Clostridium estertheticum]WBL45244.1 hypothetical protein LOR37_11050 [Clostridium estertheticum]